MICPACGNLIDDRPAPASGCGRCGGSCRKLHCPWCGHEEAVLPEYLKRLQWQAHDPKEK